MILRSLCQSRSVVVFLLLFASPSGLFAAWQAQATLLNSRARIHWAAVEGATAYRVERAAGDDARFVAVAMMKDKDREFVDAPLLNGTRYRYRVIALAKESGLASSETESVTPRIQPGTPAMMYSDSVRLLRPFAKDPTVIKFGGKYLLYYSQRTADNRWSSGIASSTDLVNWTRAGEYLPGPDGYDKKGLAAPCAKVIDGKVHLFYQSYGGGPADRLCHAVSDDGLHFTANPDNPIFGPGGKGVWSNGRAIDADYIEFNGRMLLSCATRDPANAIQQIVVASAPIGPDYRQKVWSELTPDGPTFAPDQATWEGKCIEGQTMIVHGGWIFMFYGGNYNCHPQQIGVARSKDGARWERLPSLGGRPFYPHGAPGTWNASESGHPGMFADDDGETYMFYQGTNDKGNTWYLSVLRIGWENDAPFIAPGWAKLPDLRVAAGDAVRVPAALLYPAESADTLVVSAASSNPGVLPSSALGLTGDGCGRTLEAKPVAAGSSEITLTAKDAQGRTGEVRFTLTVSAP